MDNFGRLSRVLLKKIKYLFLTPMFDFKIKDNIGYLLVYINSSYIRLKMIYFKNEWLCYNGNAIHDLANIISIINNLSYDTHFSFVLKINIDQYITINDNIDDYILCVPATNESINSLKKALLKCVSYL